MTIKTLLIDDEPLARTLVRKFLENNPTFEIVGEASDGFQGIKMIQELQPDLLFLDIQMPKLTGFEMLELIDHPPIVVFSTAYDQYAIDAFEKNALDYLLKPFSKERFLKTLEKVKLKFQENSKPSARPPIPPPNLVLANAQNRIVVKNGNKIEVLPFDEISHLEAYGDYVWIHTQKAKFLKQKTMKEFEKILSESFVRVHRSFLVNAAQILKLELYEKNTYQILMKNGAKIALSKSGYKDLKDTLGW